MTSRNDNEGTGPVGALSFPCVLILTHKHGAGVALFENLEELVQTAQGDSRFTMWAKPPHKTAESLCDMLQSLLLQRGRMISDLASLAVGIGPGSFTGLRLGCAFANGMALAHPLHLLTIETSYDETERDSWIVFEDLRQGAQALIEGRFKKPATRGQDFFVPAYGRLPTPTLIQMGLKTQT